MSKTKDILQPTNILGADIKIISVPVEVYTGHPQDEIVHTVVWSGERLDIAYTTFEHTASLGSYNKFDITNPFEHHYTNGDMTTETFGITTGIIKPGKGGRTLTLIENSIYIKATRVTYLSIDGEQII